MVAVFGAIGPNNKVHVDFENNESLLSYLEVTDVLETAACRLCTQRRKYGTFVRLVGGGQCDNADRSRHVKLFIGHTWPKEYSEEDERLNSEEVNAVHIWQSMWDVSNEMVTEAFSLGQWWSSFNSL